MPIFLVSKKDPLAVISGLNGVTENIEIVPHIQQLVCLENQIISGSPLGLERS